MFIILVDNNVILTSYTYLHIRKKIIGRNIYNQQKICAFIVSSSNSYLSHMKNGLLFKNNAFMKFTFLIAYYNSLDNKTCAKKFFVVVFRIVMASSTSGPGRSPLKAKTRVRTSLRLYILRVRASVNNAEAFFIAIMIYN